MNLPDAQSIGQLEWWTFRLPTVPNVYRKDALTGRMMRTKSFRLDVEDWCMEYLRGPWAESKPSDGNLHIFKVKDKQDAMLFKLTWCQETEKPRFSKLVDSHQSSAN